MFCLANENTLGTIRLVDNYTEDVDEDNSFTDDEMSEHDVFINGAELQNSTLDDETRHIILKRVKDREMR